ncbi:MAG: hypothetical protein RR779_15360 [Comamonas sp.]
MSAETAVELTRMHRGLMEKHTYFLLTAAGACIGFAMTQVKDLEPLREHLALALALFCWGLSFWTGCRRVDAVLTHTIQNLEVVRIHNQAGPYEGLDFTALQVEVGAFQSGMKRSNKKAQHNYRLQVLFLLVGVVCYASWQVLLMISRA